MRCVPGFLALCMLAACMSPPSKAPPSLPKPDLMVLETVTFKELAGWQDDNTADAFGAFLRSCAVFERMQDNDATGQGLLLAPASVWRETCRKAQTVPAGDSALARHFFEEYFVALRVTNNGNPAGLITGYYEPLLKGSRMQRPPYIYPVYGLPAAGTPSYSRMQIDKGMLKTQAPVIVYTDDPVKLFFLHVQGSGRALLEDGSMIGLGYAGSNGQPYVSIGRVLADRGVLERKTVTMPVLRQWLYDHPNEMWQVMWENPTYIFFREMKGDPVGTQQVPLTPGRSLAVDLRYLPMGTPVYVDTVLPETPEAPLAIHRRLLIAQDTGRAIKSPVRADIFFGYGAAAEQVAGRMKSGGQMFALVPRPLANAVLHGQ